MTKLWLFLNSNHWRTTTNHMHQVGISACFKCLPIVWVHLMKIHIVVLQKSILLVHKFHDHYAKFDLLHYSLWRFSQFVCSCWTWLVVVLFKVRCWRRRCYVPTSSNFHQNVLSQNNSARSMVEVLKSTPGPIFLMVQVCLLSVLLHFLALAKHLCTLSHRKYRFKTGVRWFLCRVFEQILHSQLLVAIILFINFVVGKLYHYYHHCPH